MGLPIYSSAESLYFETGWSKLEDRRKSRKLNLFYKIENKMAPTYLSDCLPTTIGETVTYNLHNNDDYRTQRCRLQTSSKSFFPSTIRLWNSLPDSVKSLPTFSKFKKAFFSGYNCLSCFCKDLLIISQSVTNISCGCHISCDT
jgi:hypothetical protein